MKEIVFATNNANKVKEIKATLGDGFNILTLSECGIHEDIAETALTLEGNAQLKARYVAEKLSGRDYIVFADDTGLEVDALGGAPGVYSARYSGEGTEGNIVKLLCEMESEEKRSAQFRTAICLILPSGEEHLFEGIVRGEILRVRSGEDGFGYDPIFSPEGYSVTFAEMTLNDKNSISHRGRAIRAMAEFLKNL